MLSERELESRYETYCEQYCMTVNVEANLTKKIARTMIFPAAVRYQVGARRDLHQPASRWATSSTPTRSTGSRSWSRRCRTPSASWPRRPRRAAKTSAIAATRCCPRWSRCGPAADELEGLVADDLWPLPTYQEMLFVK